MGAPDDFDLPFDFSDSGAFTSGTETLSLETLEKKEGTKQLKIAENLAIELLVTGQREGNSKLREGTLHAKLMNCNAKELSIYNEIKMKRVREVYALLAKKGKPIFSGCFDHND
ncbi:hypothetical protein POTOM_005301 [Populus tomentosa]|uniref:Uncharacterized protein n=1 Tax=Populus tomentosa TaxID=118781 RepID=A0A8X8AJ29_POPTO|nr:hypothetical protein POTOM_005301 [Populus tomentosa]